MATGEHQQPDFYSILGTKKGASMIDVCKAYKSLVTKWHPDKHPSNRPEAELKFTAINEAFKVLSDRNLEELRRDEEPTTPVGYEQSKDHSFFLKRYSFLSRTKSRSQNPTPTSMSNSSSRRNSSTNFPISPETSQASTPTTSRAGTPVANSPTSPHDPFSAPLNISSPTLIGSTLSHSRRNSSETDFSSFFSTSASRKTCSTPIVFSHSSERRKPPPSERKLECTLEELCNGSVKRIKLTRDVITPSGIIQEEETLKIRIQPGWKKGTKLTFEGKGDEKPGFLPADIIFVIDEKRHPLFKRIGDDLEIGIEVPLVQALTGCSISVPLLGGEMTHLSIDEIIYPGYEEVIQGQGMLNSKEGRRGDLRINFLVDFPKELAGEKRLEAYEILKDCC